MLDILIVAVLSLLYLSFVFFKYFSARFCPGVKGYVQKRSDFGFLRIFTSARMTVLNVFLLKMTIEQSYLNGIFGAFLFCLCEPFSYFMTYILLLRRLFKSVRCSLYEWIGYFYGNGVRSIFSFCELVSNLLFIPVNMKVIAEVLSAFGVHYGLISFLFFIFIVFVVLESSIDSNYRDNLAIFLIKFVAFLFIPVVCLLPIFIGGDKGSFNAFDSFFDSSRMNLSGCFSSVPAAFVAIAMIIRFGFPFVDSTMYSNTVYNASKQSFYEFLVSLLSVFIYSFFCVVAGFYLFGLDPTLSQGDILGYFIDVINYPVLRGVFASILLYSLFRMSVSILRSMCDIVVNDLFCVFSSQVFTSKSSKIFVVFAVSFIAYLFSVLNIDSVELFFFSSCLNFPISLVPLMCTILGLRTHKNCIYISSIAGLVGVFLFTLLTFGTEYCKFSFLPGMVLNTLFLFLSHLYYVYFKGFKFDKIEIDEISRLEADSFYEEKVTSFLNKSRMNLLLKMKSVFFNEPGFNKLGDVDIFKTFIKSDIIKACMEYKAYRFCIYKFILKRTTDFWTAFSDDDSDFLAAVNKDVLSINVRKTVKSKN